MLKKKKIIERCQVKERVLLEEYHHDINKLTYINYYIYIYIYVHLVLIIVDGSIVFIGQ